MILQKHALFIGRFQPPHNGHKKTIFRLINSYKSLTIAIGSSNKPKSEKNPFSAKTRLYLLKDLIPPKSNVKFVFLADNASNVKWTKNILKRFSKKTYTVVSANKLVRSLLSNAGYELDLSCLYNRHKWEGKKIRLLIKNNKNYKDLIPKKIFKYIKKHTKNKEFWQFKKKCK